MNSGFPDVLDPQMKNRKRNTVEMSARLLFIQGRVMTSKRDRAIANSRYNGYLKKEQVDPFQLVISVHQFS